MRKMFVWITLALCMTVFAPRPVAEEMEGADEKKFVVTGELRLRWDRLDNYFDFDDDSDDAFSFIPYRARVGVSGTLANDVQAVLEIQNFGSWGNQSPNQSFASFVSPPFQNLDGDGLPSGFRSGDTALYQAYIKLNKVGGHNLSFTLGRQEFEFGNGLILGNEDFYNGTVFDGVMGSCDHDDWGLKAFYFLTAERNDVANGSFSSFGDQDQSIAGLIGSWHLGEGHKSHVDGYLINFKDGEEAFFKPHFWTAGGHWWRSVKTAAEAEDNAFDWNLEIACQRGEAEDTSTDTDFDLSGNIIDASFGYNISTDDMLHRFHIGYLRQTGDDDVTDDDLEGWSALFPRFHGRFGDADFFGSNFGGPSFFVPAGIVAYNVGYNLDWDKGKHLVDLSLSWFKPAEDSIEDFSGSSFEIDDYGKEVDVDYWYAYSPHVTLSVGAAYLKPDDGLSQVFLLSSPFPDDPVTRFVAGARLKF